MGNTWGQPCPKCGETKFVGKIKLLYADDEFFCSKCCKQFPISKTVAKTKHFKECSDRIKAKKNSEDRLLYIDLTPKEE